MESYLDYNMASIIVYFFASNIDSIITSWFDTWMASLFAKFGFYYYFHYYFFIFYLNLFCFFFSGNANFGC